MIPQPEYFLISRDELKIISEECGFTDSHKWAMLSVLSRPYNTNERDTALIKYDQQRTQAIVKKYDLKRTDNLYWDGYETALGNILGELQQQAGKP